MSPTPLLVLAAFGLLLCASPPSTSAKQHGRGGYNQSPFNNPDENERMMAPAFQKGQEYQFQYNAQIASGLIAQDEQSQADAQQKAITRIQAQAKITFGSERHGQLCLRQIRAGQLNEPVEDEQQVKPMSIFEPKQIPSDKKRQLELCCQFDYADGVIERVQFAQEDEAWSKNMKRGVLQMIQLNLKQNNAQGLRAENDGQQQDEEDEENGENQQQDQQQKDTLASGFTIPEITVEGQCQSQYTINTANPSQRCTPDETTPCSFNVTKSINFKQCSKIADVAFGYQTQQSQPQCAQCQQQQSCQGGNCFFTANNGGAQQQQANNAQHPCAKCDPKEVKEQKVDRSTVLRFVLKCGQQQRGEKEQRQCRNCCQLERTELLAQYVYKNSKMENGQYGSAMHTVVAAQLQLQGVQPQQQQVPTQSAEADESLMYSNEWETDEKRFYMFGDEQYTEPKSQPFHGVPKVQQAEQAMRKLVQATQDQREGIEPQQAIQLQRLVQMLRMCSRNELQQIQQQQTDGQQGQQQQKAKQIFLDALAACGTRNCVKQLAEQIQQQKENMSTVKYAQSLSQLTNLPAPSDTIVQTVQHLCASPQVEACPALKQSCWLTFGALVNELCQHKTQRSAQQSVFGMQSGFQQQEQCAQDKKQQYKQAMLDQFQKAETNYEKVLALSALGNAGIDTCTQSLADIIRDQQEQRVVRVKAIDALRRLRTQQPAQIQQILLPIYQNGREQPEVRTAAFAILMYTLPAQPVLDQLAYSIGQEPNKQVQAFAYRTMKMLANSQNPVHEQISKHAKNALKLANVDEQQLRASGKWEIPACSKQQQEGLFITLATTISQRSSLPAYAHAQIDTALNDQFHINALKLYTMQQEAEQWYEQAAYQFGVSFSKTRGGRRSMGSMDSGSANSGEYNENSRQSLRDIYAALGIKSRRSSARIDQQNNNNNQFPVQQPFAMACLRTGDVDQSFIALDEQAQEQMPQPIQAVLEALKSGGGQKPSLVRFFQQFAQQQQQQIRATIAINLNEMEAVIPTACGVPLRMSNSMPVLATIQGSLKIEPENGGGFNVKIDAQPMANGVHIQKMECWMPFLVSGVESIRSVEANIPLHAELSATNNNNNQNNNQQGGQGGALQLKVKVPQGNTKLFGAHSLPVAYAAEVQQKSGLVREPRHVRAIQNPKLNRQQHETNTVVGAQNVGIPMHIQAHYHWPSQPSSFPEFAQMLMATENTIHVTCRAGSDAPNEVMFRLTADHFRPSDNQQMSQSLNTFYADKFELADSEENDYEDFQQGQQHNQQGQKLQNFLSNYQPRQQYKHSLKASMQTIGGSKPFKADAEVQAHCDAKLQVCQVQMEAQRNQMATEQQKWIMEAQAQLVMPETVSTSQEMAQLSERNNKFTCKADCQWGADQKQQIQIRIQGEQVQRSAWRQLQQGQQQQQRGGQGGQQQQRQNRLKRRTAFLNKFDLEAQYSGLKPATQNMFGRALELVKSAYYWNSNSQLIPYSQRQQQQQDGGNQANGKVLATVVIDPITQKHANISVKTPSQLVRLQQIQLPMQTRPFPLVRPNAPTIRSIGQFISRQELNTRAECTVDGNRVDTFDDQDYNSPLSTKCYSVLAKDCGSDQQSDFVVLMKAIQQKGKNGQKKLKVIGPQATIECQAKSCATGTCKSSGTEQIQCQVNGQTVNNNDDSSYVDFNNGQKSDCTVHVPGAISVRFNGRKAWLKVNSAYKSAQCGLCGHYDDAEDDDNEWRMSNNQIASNLVQFHRSYALQSQGECNQQDLDTFYQQNGKQIRKRYQQNNDDSEDDDDDDDENNNGNNNNKNNGQQQRNADEYNDDQQDWEQENFNGNYFGDSNENDDNDDEEGCYGMNCNGQNGNGCQNCDSNGQNCQNCDNNNNNNDAFNQNNNKNQQNCKGKNCGRNQQQGKGGRGKMQTPVQKTKMVEMNHDICFSTQPVKQCPRGTVPADRTTSDFGSSSSSSSSQQDNDDDDNNDNDNDDDEDCMENNNNQNMDGNNNNNQKKSCRQGPTKNVAFVCMSRSNGEARRLLRQYRQGQRVLDVSGHRQTFVEPMREPRMCRRT